MQKLLNTCSPWLTWKLAIAVAVTVVGMVLFTDLPQWSLWVGTTPLLAIVVCMLPCLIPVILLWRKGASGQSKPSN
jgi:hypothetical protein